MESTGAYGAALARYLAAAGVAVVEVNQPHTHTRARHGKTDAIDAEAAARKVLAGECTNIAKDTSGAVEAIHQLHVVRASAVKARSAALHARSTGRHRPRRAACVADREDAERQRPRLPRLRPDFAETHTALEAKHALANTRSAHPSRHRDRRSRRPAAHPRRRGRSPRTTRLLGIGTIHAVQLLVTAGQSITRLIASHSIFPAAPWPSIGERLYIEVLVGRPMQWRQMSGEVIKPGIDPTAATTFNRLL